MRAHEFGSNTTPGGLTQTHLNQYHGIIITTTTSRNGQAGQLADSDPKVFLYYTLKIFRRTNSTFVMSLSLSTVMVFVTFWVRFNKNVQQNATLSSAVPLLWMRNWRVREWEWILNWKRLRHLRRVCQNSIFCSLFVFCKRMLIFIFKTPDYRSHFSLFLYLLFLCHQVPLWSCPPPQLQTTESLQQQVTPR